MRSPFRDRTLPGCRLLNVLMGAGVGTALILALAPAGGAQELPQPLPWNWASQCRPQTGPTATVRQGTGWVQQRPVSVCVLLPPGGIENSFQSIGAGKVQVGYLLGRLDRLPMGNGPTTRLEVLSQLAFDCRSGELLRRELGSRSLSPQGAVLSQPPASVGPWRNAGPAPEAAMARSLRANCPATVR